MQLVSPPRGRGAIPAFIPSNPIWRTVREKGTVASGPERRERLGLRRRQG